MSQHFEDEDNSDLNAGWNEMFLKLKEYKQEHGHTNVPLNFDANPKLANWVHYLQWCYRRYKAGKIIAGGLNQEKIEVLENIGFQWNNLACRKI